MSEGDHNAEVNLTTALTSGEFVRVASAWTKEKGYYPNEIWHSKDERTFLIVAKASSQPGGDFSLNAAALNDMVQRVRKGHVEEAYVLFVERDKHATVYGHKPVEAMANSLKGVTPYDGKLGPFWWITREAAATDSSHLPKALRAA